MYFIKEDYRCNSDARGKPFPYEDDVYNSIHYQANVYKFAAKIINDYNLKSVLDIGCGFGLKLIEFIYPVCNKITGIDLKYSIDFCRKYLCFGDTDWIRDNIENPSIVFDEKFDLIIASDVVEHLIYPDKLFEYIKKHSHLETFIILSTPERDKVRGDSDMGPSPNLAHVREWNQEEFEKYIWKSNFTIIESSLAKDIYFSKTETCQIFLIQECKNVQ